MQIYFILSIITFINQGNTRYASGHTVVMHDFDTNDSLSFVSLSACGAYLGLPADRVRFHAIRKKMYLYNSPNGVTYRLTFSLS